MARLLVLGFFLLLLRFSASFFGNGDRDLSAAYQVIDRAQLLVSNGDYLRKENENTQAKTSTQLMKLIKWAYPQGRQQANSRVMMEWMMKTMAEETDIPTAYRFLDLFEAVSRCLGPTPNCNIPTVNTFRTIDGTCNNLRDQTQGAAFTPFQRLLPAIYEDGISQPVGFEQTFLFKNPFGPPRPSARLISTTVIQDLNIEQPRATLMLMQWGQFLDHDYAYLIESSTLSGEEIECNTCTPMGECLPIPVPGDDPQFGVGTLQDGNCLSFIRAGVSCLRPSRGRFGPRQQLNQITHWIDASNVYGSLPEEEKELRLMSRGLLKEGQRNDLDRLLPADLNPDRECPSITPCFRAGDLRANEQVVLTVMHTIFLREHNRIAGRLGQLNPQWRDERIFQEARKIVGAIAQVITYQEYLPEIFGASNILFWLGNYAGYNPNLDGSLPNAFATAAFRIGHSQVPDAFPRQREDYRFISSLPVVNAFFNPQALIDGGIDPFLRGLLSTQSQNIDPFVTYMLTNRLFERPLERMPGTDLAALNIQRGRDHGLPSYRAFRNFCTRKFGVRGRIQLPAILQKLRQLYRSEENIDLWVGGLAETPLAGGRIGPTFACIFALTFQGLREGDRFYYENPGVFTPEQLVEIRKASLSKVVCDNADRIREVQPNAFSTAQARRPCNSLPFIDLTKWQQKSNYCYLKVQIRSTVASNPSSAILYISDGLKWNHVNQQLASPAVSNVKVSCVRFTCPSPNDAVRMGVRVRARESYCRIISSITPNSIVNENVYVTTANVGVQYGVYNSLQACQGNSLFTGQAITFACN